MNNSSKNSLGPIVIIGILFFIFGFITWLNATLIPYLRISCELTSFESYLVTMAFYISYFVMALPSSYILNKVGFKNGMALGLVVMAVGALIFIPAAFTREYSFFLIGLFVQGTGLAILQTAANPYVTIVGPIESAAKRISIMGVANKVAGILSPIILGAIVLDGTDALVEKIKTLDAVQKAAELDMLSEKVIMPYAIIAVSLVVLAVFIKLSSLPEIENEEEEVAEGEHTKTSILQFPNLILGVIALFLYVGAEVIAVDTLISYGSSLGFSMEEAKFFSSFTLGAMIFGYFIGIFTIPKYLSQSKALALFAGLGVLFVSLALITSGFTSILFIAALGLANSIMWPAIWPLAIDGLGKFIKQGSALLIMAIAGGATIPLLYGYLSSEELLGSQMAYIILIPAYLYILFYAMKGSRLAKM
jgi:glucose/galactose transporter